jgi:hypothetical protein
MLEAINSKIVQACKTTFENTISIHGGCQELSSMPNNRDSCSTVTMEKALKLGIITLNIFLQIQNSTRKMDTMANRFTNPFGTMLNKFINRKIAG